MSRVAIEPPTALLDDQTPAPGEDQPHQYDRDAEGCRNSLRSRRRSPSPAISSRVVGRHHQQISSFVTNSGSNSNLVERFPRKYITNSGSRDVERRQLVGRSVSKLGSDISNAALGELDTGLLQDLGNDTAAGLAAMAVARIARRLEPELSHPLNCVRHEEIAPRGRFITALSWQDLVLREQVADENPKAFGQGMVWQHCDAEAGLVSQVRIGGIHRHEVGPKHRRPHLEEITCFGKRRLDEVAVGIT
jgi:hypothetical protein